MKSRWNLLPLLVLVLCVSVPPVAKAQSAAGFEPFWIMNHRATALWPSHAQSGTPVEEVPGWRYLKVVGGQQGPWLYVLDPITHVQGFVPAEDIGPASAPPAWYLTGPTVLNSIGLPGRTIGTVDVRSLPQADTSTFLSTLGHNSPAFVRQAVRGADGATWYDVGNGQYILASAVRLPGSPGGGFEGRWIDVDLNEPAVATAYEGNRAVYSTLAIKGKTAFLTPTGTFRILRRVDNETMDSSTVGIPRNGPGGYYLKNVLFTQYFTSGGASIHYNYWSSNWGYQDSHGCLGMSYDDSLWFWNWADVGTPVVIHS